MIPYREKKSPYDAGPDNRNEPDQLRRHHFPRLDSYERCRSNSDISDRPLPPPNLNGQELNRSSSTSQRQRSNTYDWSPAATHGGTNHQHVRFTASPIMSPSMPNESSSRDRYIPRLPDSRSTAATYGGSTGPQSRYMPPNAITTHNSPPPKTNASCFKKDAYCPR